MRTKLRPKFPDNREKYRKKRENGLFGLPRNQKSAEFAGLLTISYAFSKDRITGKMPKLAGKILSISGHVEARSVCCKRFRVGVAAQSRDGQSE
jgi:hypothetical protein